MNFKLGQPFRPFQQLMGVLPDRSKKIVPQAYHDLMTSPDSPIIDFYPRDFELDMNGKKMEWEAVVKIPFIEEDRLLSAMSTKEHALTEAEKERNEFGVTLKFTYSPDTQYIYPSSLVGVFPDIQNCRCVVNVFDLPTMEGLEPYIGLVEGAKLGAGALAGFPSLKTLPHTGQLGFHGVNVFSQDSRNESMVVTLMEPESRSGIEAAKTKLEKRVYIGYPFLQEAKVDRVSDELFDYILPAGEQHVQSISHTPHQIEQWRKKAHQIESTYSKRMGMIVGDVEAIIHVQTLKGMRKTEDGAAVKEFGDVAGIETDYAAQLVVDEVVCADERFIEQEALPIEEEFPELSRAFFLGEFNYGRPVHVTGHDGGKVTGLVASVKGREPEFGREHVRNAERLSPYTPSFAIARNLQLNPLTLAKITSSFQVKVGEQRANLGLNLKFEAKKLKVLGYSRRGPSGWEFSQKAVELLQEYMIKFPEFIAGIQRKPRGDLFESTDFYPADEASARIKEIQAWLKSVESKSFERVPLEAEQLDSDVVKAIERDSDQLVRTQPPAEAKKMKGVPRSALLKPSDAEHRLGNQRFSLGDRLVYAQDSGKVPIATRGTVVGLTRTSRTILLDVVFDVSFMSGTTLGDRCSPFRGSTVPISSVLNLTDKQLVTGTRAKPNQTPNPEPLTAQGYGAPLGPGGQGQLRYAPTPPQLRGSWRGAVTGQQPGYGRGTGPARGRGAHGDTGAELRSHSSPNLAFRPHPKQQNGGDFGGRGNRANFGPRGGGRGGFNRGGYNSIDPGNPDPTVVDNNPNFRPQSHNQVPPPPDLNSRGRGGPRGGRRGNSNGPRGRGRGADRGRGAAIA